MIFLAISSAVAGVLGLFVVPRLGVLGFVLAALLTFAVQLGLNLSDLYEGFDWAGTMAFFNDSLGAYLGYEAKVTYRASAVPMAVLGLASVIGLGRQRR